MLKKLLALDEAKLRLVARDFSITTGSRTEIAAQLTEYLKAYGLRWADLACRYSLAG